MYLCVDKAVELIVVLEGLIHVNMDHKVVVEQLLGNVARCIPT